MARLTAEQIHSLLARDDKHSLGGGGLAIWAPEAPRYLDAPGFWDHACFLEHRVPRLFTITLLLENGRSLPLKLNSRMWKPACLTQAYLEQDGIQVEETKSYLNDALVSRITIRSTTERERRLQAVVWTQQPRGGSKNSSSVQNERIRDGRIEYLLLRPGMFGAGPQPVAVVVGLDREPNSSAIKQSEGVLQNPRWDLTPFYETLTRHGLPGEPHSGTEAWDQGADLHVFAALEFPLEVPAEDQVTFTAYAALADTRRQAGSIAARASGGDAVEQSLASWGEVWESVPSFSCDDPYLERAYWYRWYGLRLNSIRAGSEHNLPHPCVFEGVNYGWFRHAISYSSQALMRDLRWMRDPDVAQGCLLNFVANQREDGSYPGGIATTLSSNYDGFYHANWGSAIKELVRVHPDEAFLRAIYGSLKSYADYFQRERDPEGWHLYDIVDQWETGQEYMGRYLAVEERADRGERFRLKGIDATCYVYELYVALGWMAEELGHPQEAKSWEQHARATARAVRERLWDPELRFFTDLDPVSGRRVKTLSATGFYPFMSDIAQPEHLDAIHEHLFDPEKFWSSYPVPSTALTERNASESGEWKGVRMNCPWNGRSWLMTNSHVCLALARAALVLDETLRDRAAELIRRCIRMTFLEGDPTRPSSYEYYNPMNGKAPLFRATNDYMHSWVIDLIIQYVAGLQPKDGDLIAFDPLPFGLKRFELEDVHVKGRRLAVRWEQFEGFTVEIDGEEAVHRKELGSIEVSV